MLGVSTSIFSWHLWGPLCQLFAHPQTRAHIKANVSGGGNHTERSNSNQFPWADVSRCLWQTRNNTHYSTWQQSHKSNPTAISLSLGVWQIQKWKQNNQIAMSLLSWILSALLNGRYWTNALSHYSNYFIKPSPSSKLLPLCFSLILAWELFFFKT